MGALVFISSLVWPAIVLVAVLLFRKPILRLLAEAEEGEIGPKGVRWKRQAERVEASAAQATAKIDEAQPVNVYEQYHAETMPQASIEGAYARIQRRLAEMVDQTIDVHGRPDALLLAQEALRKGLISASSLDSIEGLMVMRDLSRSSPERTTTQKAQEFQVLASAVLYALRDRQ